MSVQHQQVAAVPEAGDIVPRLALRRPSGAGFDLFADDEAGRFQLLLFSGGTGRAGATLDGFAKARGALEELGVQAHLVVADGGAANAGEAAFPTLVDSDGAGFATVGMPVAFGCPAGDGLGVLLVGPNLHVLLCLPPAEAEAAVAGVLDRVRALAARRRAEGVPAMHPPVLMVPDVLGPADCRQLISIYSLQGQEFVEPGHNRLQGRTTDCKMRIPDYGRSDRIDHWVCAPATNEIIDRRLVPRLMPEIAKAFNYQVTRHERYRIACYEGIGSGAPHGHRDNTQPLVAHRRFAVTINLNADEYEGGELRFPEFSEAVYKPPTGAAIVFSCSLLHEVMAMRSGRRFALLAFLFGET